MGTGSAITHVECRDCGETYSLELTEYPCRDCGEILDPQYDLEAVGIDRSEWARWPAPTRAPTTPTRRSS